MASIYKPYNFSITPQEEVVKVTLTAICQVPDEKEVLCSEASDEPFGLKPFAVRLHAELPVNYPSERQPIITSIEGPFLSQGIDEKIREELSSMWSQGNPVLFDWCHFLQEDLQTVLFLGQEEPYKLASVEDMKAYKSAVWLALTFLLGEREQNCDICYETLIGTEKFTITLDCNHYFCKECIRDYLVSNVSSGRVVNIACPSSGCK